MNQIRPFSSNPQEPPYVEDDAEGYWIRGIPYVFTGGMRRYIFSEPLVQAPGMKTNLSKDGNMKNYFAVYGEYGEDLDNLDSDNVKLEGDYLIRGKRKDEFPYSSIKTYKDLRYLLPSRKLFETLLFVIPPPNSKLSIFSLGRPTKKIQAIFSAAETVTLKAGTVVYHGSRNYELALKPLKNIPFWVSLDQGTADLYAGVVYEFTLTRDVTLFKFESHNIERAYAASKDVDALIHEGVIKTAFPQMSPLLRQSLPVIDSVLAYMICMTGYDGYYADSMESVRGGDFHGEIMICKPRDILHLELEPEEDAGDSSDGSYQNKNAKIDRDALRERKRNGDDDDDDD